MINPVTLLQVIWFTFGPKIVKWSWQVSIFGHSNPPTFIDSVQKTAVKFIQISVTLKTLTRKKLRASVIKNFEYKFENSWINTLNIYITAKLTSEAENKGDILPDEPESWFAKKKKSFEKVNRRTRRHCRKAVKSQGMFWLIIILVFLNTCVLATEHYRQPAWLDYFQEYVNLFFVVLFTFEMVLKMYSLGFQVSHLYIFLKKCLQTFLMNQTLVWDCLMPPNVHKLEKSLCIVIFFNFFRDLTVTIISSELH